MAGNGILSDEETLGENTCTVLVVNDNPDIRSCIKTILNDKQYTVLEAIDGKEGFRKAVKHIPNIIISDVVMPKMDGVELRQKLKSSSRPSIFQLYY
ncbi:MAG: response regulator [Dysgonamonadaceae bacterium]|jgi:CheY-like chemotaxis protein|nr:response regulator [Dysgonamonadaceae bacterium]